MRIMALAAASTSKHQCPNPKLSGPMKGAELAESRFTLNQDRNFRMLALWAFAPTKLKFVLAFTVASSRHQIVVHAWQAKATGWYSRQGIYSLCAASRVQLSKIRIS